MAVDFDPIEYARFLRTRWRLLFTICLAAGILAAGISLSLSKRYTATASILIDAPAGNDPRAATAVSPVYLESLRTYERFAESDTLFVRAIERFQLLNDAGNTPVDSLKRRTLKVTKPRDTKLLEISVTWTDPTKAQAMAQFIAEETVSLNQSLTRRSDDEFTEQSRRQVEVARSRLDEAQKLLGEAAANSPVESIQSEMRGLIDLKTYFQRELTEANADIAYYSAQRKAQSSETPSLDSERLQRDLAGATARAESLRKELESVSRRISEKELAVGERITRLERLDADRRSARSAYDAALVRWTEAEAAVGIRGERLKIIDPGIVPQRPSSPNLPLNVFTAILTAFIAALLWITITFVLSSNETLTDRRPVYR